MSNICWSANNEDFDADSLSELIANNEDLKAGDTVYMGEAVIPSAEDLVRTYDVIDAIRDRAYDMVGEHAEDFGVVGEDAETELKNLLIGWVNKHCQINFWEVKDSSPYVITEADMAEATI